MPCPVCRGTLGVIGSRNRIWKQTNGERYDLRIRRMRCERCQTIHHELPDFLIPYKHYDAPSIETVVHQKEHVMPVVGAETSTIARWNRWFSFWLTYAVNSLRAMTFRYFHQAPNPAPSLPGSSVLQLVGPLVGAEDGWLARLVRPLLNTHSWLHTRVAFLSHRRWK